MKKACKDERQTVRRFRAAFEGRRFVPNTASQRGAKDGQKVSKVEPVELSATS